MAIQRRSIEVGTEETRALAYRVTVKKHTEFKAICKKDGVTVSAMLEKIVDDYLNRRKR